MLALVEEPSNRLWYIRGQSSALTGGRSAYLTSRAWIAICDPR